MNWASITQNFEALKVKNNISLALKINIIN